MVEIFLMDTHTPMMSEGRNKVRTADFLFFLYLDINIESGMNGMVLETDKIVFESLHFGEVSEYINGVILVEINFNVATNSDFVTQT